MVVESCKVGQHTVIVLGHWRDSQSADAVLSISRPPQRNKTKKVEKFPSVL